jgi:hypothetical protein
MDGNMNPIRQALHSAARYYASNAHRHWLDWQRAIDAEFKFAMSGHVVNRMQASHKRAESYAQYNNMITMAHRCREMMK